MLWAFLVNGRGFKELGGDNVEESGELRTQRLSRPMRSAMPQLKMNIVELQHRIYVQHSDWVELSKEKFKQFSTMQLLHIPSSEATSSYRTTYSMSPAAGVSSARGSPSELTDGASTRDISESAIEIASSESMVEARDRVLTGPTVTTGESIDGLVVAT
jgi:hypothetical protein